MHPNLASPILTVNADDGPTLTCSCLLPAANSDTDKLHEQAQEVRQQQIVSDVLEQRARIKELRGHLDSQPTETDTIRDMVAVLSSVDSLMSLKLIALQNLQDLVGQIDNANNLKPLNGIRPLVETLKSELWVLKANAAHVIGIAASNNVQFQQDVLEIVPDIFQTLTQVGIITDCLA